MSIAKKDVTESRKPFSFKRSVGSEGLTLIDGLPDWRSRRKQSRISNLKR